MTCKSGRLDMADAAYCAAAWASGEKQKDLAVLFGLRTPTMVSLAIRAFLNAYAADGVPPVTRYLPRGNRGDVMFDRCIYQDERKALIPGALARFRQAHG